MLEWIPSLTAASVIIALAFIAWLVSIRKNDTSIVDSFWGMFFLAGALAYSWQSSGNSERAVLVLLLIAAWSVRLTLHISVRNWGEPEDRRYQAIRARNEPGFAAKSLYLVFGLQSLLAFVIALPVFVALGSSAPLGPIDAAAALLWTVGFLFEVIGDLQLGRFRADPANQGKVMQQGLWRYTRHPNYFGEAVLWWGFFLFGLAAGGAWTVFSPLVMTLLLLKVSGVALLEKDIAERRPEYRAYMTRTSAFIPRLPRA